MSAIRELKALRLSALALIAASICPAASADPGLPTRNLNPVLQSILIPAYVNPDGAEGWRADHSVYVSNNFQREAFGNERLLIDVENYRYELGLQYHRSDWTLRVQLPLSANRGGGLDSLIEDWHKVFGLPNGNRERVERNDINIEYVRDGVAEFSRNQTSSGLGDLLLAVGYQPYERIGYFLGIELPTGSSSNFTSNESIDVALWTVGDAQVSPKINLYGLLGVSFPGDGGKLEGLLAEQIWAAQAGFSYRVTEQIDGFAQLDVHSESIPDSALDAFGDSFQIQLGLGFDDWLQNHRVELFISEDIGPGTAPDISLGFRMVGKY